MMTTDSKATRQPTNMLTVRLIASIALLLAGLMLRSIECAAQTQKTPAAEQTQIQQAYKLDPAIPLAARVRNTPADVLKMFQDAGMSPRQHVLTDAERLIVANAFAVLPPLHQRILKAHLRSISFLDEMPNTALTSVVDTAALYPLFGITFRAGILSQNVSEWLTEKERTCFEIKGSPQTVAVEAGLHQAFEYVLLHEITHVVDGSLHLTPASRAGNEPQLNKVSQSSFVAGVWQKRTVAVTQFRDTLLEKIRFRRGGKVIPIDQAKTVYTALQRTPFVSLYGSSAWTEDLAEYVAVYHFTQQLKQPFRIVIRKNGQMIFVYEPMKSTLVQRRHREMKRFYS
jgi:hypothetical protein